MTTTIATPTAVGTIIAIGFGRDKCTARAEGRVPRFGGSRGP
jgi:hypothetical protein